VRFEVHAKKDLASDEALWALYERWCKFYGEQRSQDEMCRRFNEFKDTVLYVYRRRKQPKKFAITPFADGKLNELMFGRVSFPPFCYRVPPNTQIDVKVGKALDEKERFNL
jgi:hypothetical protein